MPTDGRPPIVITDRGAINDWVPEPATPACMGRADGPGVDGRGHGACAYRRRWLEGGRLSHVRSVDGVVNHSSYAEVVRRLPSATFEDATDVVGLARYVKSDEEIANLRRATEIAEAGIDEMIEVARPGVDEAVLYARVTGRMLEMGSEWHPLAMHTDPIDLEDPHRWTNPPLGRRLQPNALITNEVSAVRGAQMAQEDQPVLLGPIPDAWRPVIDLQREVFEAGLNYMTPGRSFEDMIDFVNGFGAGPRHEDAHSHARSRNG